MADVVDLSVSIAANLATDVLKAGGERWLNQTYVGAALKLRLGKLDDTTATQFHAIFLEAFTVYFTKHHPERQLQDIYDFFRDADVQEMIFRAVFDTEPAQLSRLNNELRGRLVDKPITRMLMERKSLEGETVIKDFLDCYVECERKAMGVPWMALVRELRRSDDVVVERISEAIAKVEAAFEAAGISDAPALIEELREAIGQFTEIHQRLKEWKYLHWHLQGLAISYSSLIAERDRARRHGGRSRRLDVDYIEILWTSCRKRLHGDLLGFAHSIEHIGMPFGTSADGTLYGEPWAIELCRLGDRITNDLEHDNLGGLYDALDSFDQALGKHLSNADRDLKKTADKLIEMSFRLAGKLGV